MMTGGTGERSVGDLFTRPDRIPRDASLSDLRKTVAAILQDRRAVLRLGPADIAFLAVVQHWLNEESAGSLSYARLTELYHVVLEHDDEASHGRDAEVPRSVNRLIDQRVLIEHASAAVLHDRGYALGPIGRAIANAYDVGQTLEAGRLTALLLGLQSELAEAIEAVSRAQANEALPDLSRTWAVVGGLIADIEARRVNLDYRQELLRAQIPEMMALDTWDDAIVRCRDVLRSSYQAAEEVKLCLLDGHHRLQKQIDRLMEMTRISAPDIARDADDLEARLALLATWASNRFGSWAGFYRQAMHFLAEMVRIDPHRTLARVLNEQIKSYVTLMAEEEIDPQRLPYSLPVCRAEPHLRVRPAESPELGAPTAVAFEVPIDETLEPGLVAQRLIEIERVFANSLAATGEADMHLLLEGFSDIPPAELSQLAGRVIQLMLQRGQADPHDAPTILVPLAPGLMSERLRVVSTEGRRHD